MIRLTDQLDRAARMWPDHPAVSSGDRQLSWSDIKRRVEGLARALHAQGVRPGDRVAFLGFNSHVGVECYYAPALIGAAVVPLNTRLSERELVACINDCRPKVMVVDTDHVPSAQAIMRQCPVVQSVFHAGEAELPQGMITYETALSTANPDLDFDTLAGRDDDMLIMYYTGGTTGTPKGVMLSHANIFANAMATLVDFQYLVNEAHFMTGPLFHTAGGARVFIAPLMGIHLVLMPKFDVVELMRLVAKHRVALLQFVPTMMVTILDHPLLDSFDMSSLRLLTYGGAPMPPDLLDRMVTAFPGIGFGQAFGMTEASPILTILKPEHHTDKGEFTGKLNSAGRPVCFVDLRIVDPKGENLPSGAIGEIVARGPNMMKGYWDKPGLTEEVLRRGWYHTGDSGYLDADGFLFVTGRIKDMIITGGENVYPIECENMVTSHPAVQECAVIGTPDEKWGERVHAVIVLHTGKPATAAEIKHYCRENLAHYKCPTLISFRTLPLPHTSIGKIDKVTLRAEYQTGEARG